MTPKQILESSTMQGAIATFFVFLASPDMMGLLPEKVAMGLGAAGTLLTVFGLRKAQDKAIKAAAMSVAAEAATGTVGRTKNL